MSDGNGRSSDGFGIDRDASVMLIVRTALDHGVSDPRQIAYMLATAQHETRNFAAPEEDFGRSQARKLGYSGGEDFFGRGYVHLTHDYNYRKFDELLGLQGELVSNPALAKEPEIAAKILVIGMRDGLFTGKRLDRYINEGAEDSYNARRVVNGITRQAWTIKAAQDCERYAEDWEAAVPILIEQARAQDKSAPASWEQELRRTLDRVVPPRPVAGGIIDGLPDYLRVHDASPRVQLGNRIIQQGSRGSEVRALQEMLGDHGIRDGHARPVAVDGIFGISTRQAVENFQLWHGLDTSGVMDGDTRRALLDPRRSVTSPRPGDAAELKFADRLPERDVLEPSDPSHPDHSMYERIRAGVRAIDEGSGKCYDEASERISRNLLARCKGAGVGADVPLHPGTELRSVDHVVLGTTGTLFAIEGRLGDPAHRRVGVCVEEAARVPVEESDRLLASTDFRRDQAACGHQHAALTNAGLGQTSPGAMPHRLGQ